MQAPLMRSVQGRFVFGLIRVLLAGRVWRQRQIFGRIDEDEAMDWYNYWRDERLKFYKDVLNFRPEATRTHDHEKLAHYAKAAMDIEFEFPFGWGELEGIHHRGTWDLSQHAEQSKQMLYLLSIFR